MIFGLDIRAVILQAIKPKRTWEYKGTSDG